MTKFLLVLLFFLPACNSEKDWVCVDGNCDNGNGTRLWKDSGYEKGTWKNGKLNGQGKQFFGNTSDFTGDTYNGEFKDDKYDGKGTYNDKSIGSTYVGDFKNGQANGIGIVTFDSTSKFANQYYKGEWKDGKKEGYGTEFFGTMGKYKNDKYIGQWKNDRMDGIGKYFFSTGSSYEGHWQNNLQQGDGIRIDKNGKAAKVHCETGDCVSVENN